MKKRTWTNLNIETKIFFLILLFLFILGVLFIKKDPFFSYTNLSLSAGALLGFIYLYGIGRLKISKGKEKYILKNRIIWKEMNIEIKRFFVSCFALLLIGYIILLIEKSQKAVVAICVAAGALITLYYFYGTKRLKVFK